MNKQKTYWLIIAIVVFFGNMGLYISTLYGNEHLLSQASYLMMMLVSALIVWDYVWEYYKNK